MALSSRETRPAACREVAQLFAQPAQLEPDHTVAAEYPAAHLDDVRAQQSGEQRLREHGVGLIPDEHHLCARSIEHAPVMALARAARVEGDLCVCRAGAAEGVEGLGRVEEQGAALDTGQSV